MISDRKALIYLAKVAEQMDRYEEMTQYIKQVGEMDQELNEEERILLSLAYYYITGERQSTLRILQKKIKEEYKQQAQPHSQKHLELIKSYRLKIESELIYFCNELFNLINNLVDKASTAEAKVFYFKMKGDYYRRICEFSSDDNVQKNAINGGLQAYQCAFNVANSEFRASSPIKLQLLLNFSIFYYMIINDTATACIIAQQAIDSANEDIKLSQGANTKDTMDIINLIQDNLTLWNSELNLSEK